MIIFDALIGNVDRNWDNYGVIKIWDASIPTIPALIDLECSMTEPLFLDELLMDEFLTNEQTSTRPKLEEITTVHLTLPPLFDQSNCLFALLSDETLPSTPEAMEVFSRHCKSKLALPGQQLSNHVDLLRYVQEDSLDFLSSNPLKGLLRQMFLRIKGEYDPAKIKGVLTQHHFGYFSEHRVETICQFMNHRFQQVERLILHKQEAAALCVTL